LHFPKFHSTHIDIVPTIKANSLVNAKGKFVSLPLFHMSKKLFNKNKHVKISDYAITGINKEIQNSWNFCRVSKGERPIFINRLFRLYPNELKLPKKLKMKVCIDLSNKSVEKCHIAPAREGTTHAAVLASSVPQNMWIAPYKFNAFMSLFYENPFRKLVNQPENVEGYVFQQAFFEDEDKKIIKHDIFYQPYKIVRIETVKKRNGTLNTKCYEIFVQSIKAKSLNEITLAQAQELTGKTFPLM
jgi:hypothetical protein